MTVWQREDGKWEGKFVYKKRQHWVTGGPFRTEEEARAAEDRQRRGTDPHENARQLERRRQAPHSVYRLFSGDEVVYVGITSVGVNRIADHAKLRSWWVEVTSATFEHVGSFYEADARETELIEELRPKYNVAKLPEVLPEGMVDGQAVADHLKFKRDTTIFKMVADGLLPKAGETERGTPYFNLAEIDEWVQAGLAARRLTGGPTEVSTELVSFRRRQKEGIS